MLPPKLGLLSTMVNAHVQGLRKDIIFVPVSISYENVIEDRVYGTENTGARKEKESLVSLFQARSIFRQKYGEVIISFDTPISLKEFIGENGQTNTKAQVTELANLITDRIRTRTNPGLTAVACTALMSAPNYGLSRRELIAAIKNLALQIEIMRSIDPDIGVYTSSLRHFLDGQHAILDNINRSGLVEIGPCAGELIFSVPGTNRFTADFYKNSIAHLFFPLSLLALLEAMDRELTEENILLFHKLFGSDFLLGCPDQFFRKMEKVIQLGLEKKNSCTAWRRGFFQDPRARSL